MQCLLLCTAHAFSCFELHACLRRCCVCVCDAFVDQVLDAAAEAEFSGSVPPSCARVLALRDVAQRPRAATPLTRVPPLLPHSTNKIRGLELLGNSKELFSCKLTDAHVGALVDAILTGSVIVEGLFLCYNLIGDAGAAALARLFTDAEGYTCTLKSLHLEGNDVAADGCAAVVNAVRESGNTTLTYLNLNRNPIGQAGGLAVAELLASNATLQTVNLGDCELDTTALVALCTVLQTNSTVRVMSLDNPRLFSRTEDTTYHVSRMLRCNTGLTRLSLAKHGITDVGAKLLGEYLADNATLMTLDLTANRISSVGAEALAELLLRGSPIEQLLLRANPVADGGAAALAVAMARCPHLVYVDMRSCSVHGKGLAAVADAIRTNTSLATVLLWGNHFDDQASRDAMAAALEANTAVHMDVRAYEVDGKVQVAEQDASLSV